ncbi:MAG TPA: hypothetical protein VFK80_08240, partial [Limnochordia bacterium]|nr:hypothetical protein [Limnochordia bacterium]
SETRQEVAAADDDSDQAMREREDMAAMERADANTAVTEPATPAEREVALADLHRSEDTTAARNAVPPQAEPTLDQRIRLQMIDVPLGAAFGRAETITIEMLAAMREAAYKRVMAADRALKAARALADVYETDELPADMMGPIWARFEAEVGA